MLCIRTKPENWHQFQYHKRDRHDETEWKMIQFIKIQKQFVTLFRWVYQYDSTHITQLNNKMTGKQRE